MTWNSKPVSLYPCDTCGEVSVRGNWKLKRCVSCVKAEQSEARRWREEMEVEFAHFYEPKAGMFEV